jgi:type II secretory pathway predicted ATPase ExeA
MTRKILKLLSPEQALAALLDAAAAELMAASEREINVCLDEAGAEGRDVIETMRRLVSAAEADSNPTSVSAFYIQGLRDHLTRSH